MTKQLIFQLARFGDIIQTKRLVRSLQLDGEVQLCVDASLQELARLVYPDLQIYGLPAFGCAEHDILTTGRKIFTQLQAEKYDHVFILNHSGLSRPLGALFEPGRAVGYIMDKGQGIQSNWVRLAFRWMANRAAAPLNLMDYWAGLAPRKILPDSVNPASRPGGKGLGVVLAGQNARRSLPVKLYVPLIHAAFARLGGPTVYLLGTGKEQNAARELMTCLPGFVAQKTINLTGRTDWLGLIEAVCGLDLLLSPDTGTVHLAAHLGVPVEGLYFSSAWAFETGPYGEGHTVWQSLAQCSPCVESQPCPNMVLCGDCFGQPAFLLRMQGKKPQDKPLANMLKLRSGFDYLGEIWDNDSETVDPFTLKRQKMRAQLGEYLGQGSALDSEVAQVLYQETDWILTQAQP